jgi:hypothetical protein
VQVGISMEKVDHKKVLKEFYKPSPKKPMIVNVPEMSFLMIDGKGSPLDTDYQNALMALYPMAYTIKFDVKKAKLADFTVMPLEGLWWIEGETEFNLDRKDDWSWTSMIMQPDVVTKEIVKEAKSKVIEKNKAPSISKLKFESYHEGLSVQIMHIGPYADESPTIEHLHAYAEEEGFRLRGKHHEIYLSDPRRTAPERLKTVIRQPIE